MKTFWIFCISLLFLGSISAQDGNKLLKALASGQTQKVTRHFAPKVEVCYGDDVFFLPKAKAADKFAAIIKDLNPKSITPLHKGSSDNHSANYIIGDVKSSKGRYRLFIFAKKRGEKIIIKEVRLEPY